MLNFDKLTDTEVDKIANALRVYLRSYRLANYGYSDSDFRRLQSQRQRCKRALDRAFSTTIVRNALAHPRLRYDQKSGTWDYVVGQSANEEITNLIAYLADYKTRGWLS